MERSPLRTWGRPTGRAATGFGAAGALALAYAAGYERTAYTLRRVVVPVLAQGAQPLHILHISDLHITPNQKRKLAWIADLARLVPDLVALTGDVLSHPDADEPTLLALSSLFGFPGVFVPGNNDYYVPTLKSPHRYLLSKEDSTPKGPPLDWAGFAKSLAADSGWLDLTNTRTVLRVAGQRIDVRGVDDARLKRDDLSAVLGPRDNGDVDLMLGLSHTPEPRVLDAYTADGVALTLSGHTHGGQIRVPFVGALVANCGLDRGRVRGLSRYEAGGRSSWLHVSAGLGTSPFAPIRFACRPEATLITLAQAAWT
ncbi:metallophosphoesterase [Candidatus Protofrankia californiensis]|uniref:metallophosphoesterase n=1 Tax=Candidatus Protofrankia californiensis TaxID=1839754 RepID=UPI00104180E5|nr:metallophosphoesterase [Candidatus Protofrankia californiensis]